MFVRTLTVLVRIRLPADLIILVGTPPSSSEDSMPSNLPASSLPCETLLARYPDDETRRVWTRNKARGAPGDLPMS